MSFVEDLQNLINKHSLEQYSETPDFLLAEFLKGCLTAYESTVKKRDKWCKNATTKREIDLTTMIGPGLNRDFPEKKSEYILCSDYHKKHVVCPKCLKVPPLSTNIGYVQFKFSDGNCYQANHKDENMRECKCGWEGIEHDLIPAPPKPPELSERQ